MQPVTGRNANGFTLIELMIVVAIIGILAAIAVPQYRQHVIKGNRAAAQAFMMDVASRQKQYLLDARTYATDIPTLQLSVPSDVSKNYTISMTVTSTPLAFTVRGTPIAGNVQASDGELTLTDTGSKTPPNKW